MHYFGYGVEKNLEKAKSYYKKACELGDEKGCEVYDKIWGNQAISKPL